MPERVADTISQQGLQHCLCLSVATDGCAHINVIHGMQIDNYLFYCFVYV